ncbi:MAG: hypothetical protein ABI779_10560 [Acidobacteriota bacterium]
MKKILGRGRRSLVHLASLLLLVLAAGTMAAQDVITVGTVTADGPTVDVPVYIRDVAGTTLGMDKPAGSKIQAFTIKVIYAPASAISSVTFSRAGITASLSPTFEFNPSSPGTITLGASFQESTNPIPFTNAGGPGNLVAHMVFTFSPTATPGTPVTLSLDGSGGLTQLNNTGGTAAETTANGQLSLVDGAINIPVPSLTITPSSSEVEVNGTRTLTVTASTSLIRTTSVALSSSSPSNASVPSSVSITAGSRRADISVDGIAVGTAVITATLPASMGGATSNAEVNVVPATTSCTTPGAPAITASASVVSGATYAVTWPAVGAATEYSVEEATEPTFAAPSSRVVTTPTASFTHSVSSDTRYYYRVRARNLSTGCSLTGAFSNVASVLVQASVAPVQALRILPVVGSTAGDQGSFFKTSMQLFNVHDAAISGQVILHRSGTADVPLAYALAPGKGLAWDDLLAAMGTSGVGTADILADVGSALPVSSVRVFNDAGAAGTTGLNEDALRVEDALQAGQSGAIIAPSDFVRFRLNIGVRSLEQGATISILVRDIDGSILKTLERTYGSTSFSQVTSTQMLDGLVLKGGESLTFTTMSGSAFIYGATTDNKTNDPSMQLVHVRD